jgi:hypothetical protein
VNEVIEGRIFASSFSILISAVIRGFLIALNHSGRQGSTNFDGDFPFFFG